MIYSLLYLIESLVFIYLSWLCGHLIFSWSKISFKSGIKKITLPIITGYGIVGTIGLVFALLGIYKTYYFLTVFFLVILLNRKIIIKHFKLLKPKKIHAEIKRFFNLNVKKYKILSIILLFWVCAYLVLSFFPWNAGDDGLFYHLPFIQEIINKGSISFPVKNYINYGHLPLFVEILYGVPALLFKNFIVANIIQFSAFLLLMTAIFGFIFKYLKNKIFSFVLVIILFSNMPFVNSGVFGGLIDIFTFLFGITSSLIILELILEKQKKEKEIKMLILSGALLGFAIATKYLALFFVLINSILLLYHFLSGKKSVKNIFKKFILFLPPIILFGGFWYLKNYIYTGNPFFPIFSGGSGLGLDIERFTVERNFLNFFIFPFSFWGLDAIFKLPYAVLNALYFASIYLLGALLIWKKKITKLEVLLFAYIQIYFLLTFMMSHQIRFSIPALIIADLLLILLIDKTYSLINEKFAINKKIVYILVCVAAVAFLGFGVKSFDNIYACAYPTKNTECMAKKGAVIYAVNYINKNIENEKIINYWQPYYSYSLKNNNSFVDYSCYNELSIKETRNYDIKTCLGINNIKYLLDDTQTRIPFTRNPKLNINKEKTYITEYFIENGEIIFEKYYEPHNTYIRLYKLK